MRQIPLTRGKYTLVDDGDFEWLSQWNWQCVNGYAVRTIRLETGKRMAVFMHRLILDTPAGMDTDHVNRNPLDNRRANLRAATRGQNLQNSEPRVGCSSRFKGVCWHKRDHVWQANIRKDGKFMHLGTFNNELEAAIVYDKAARELFGTFARLNNPQIEDRLCKSVART